MLYVCSIRFDEKWKKNASNIQYEQKNSPKCFSFWLGRYFFRSRSYFSRAALSITYCVTCLVLHYSWFRLTTLNLTVSKMRILLVAKFTFDAVLPSSFAAVVVVVGRKNSLLYFRQAMNKQKKAIIDLAEQSGHSLSPLPRTGALCLNGPKFSIYRGLVCPWHAENRLSLNEFTVSLMEYLWKKHNCFFFF